MKNIKIIWLSFILVSACAGEDYSKYNNLYPPNAEISPYDNIPGLVKVTIRDEAGRILGEGDFYKGVNHGPWAEYDPATGFFDKV